MFNSYFSKRTKDSISMNVTQNIFIKTILFPNFKYFKNLNSIVLLKIFSKYFIFYFLDTLKQNEENK